MFSIIVFKVGNCSYHIEHRSYRWIFLCDYLPKLLEIDPVVFIFVGILDHLLYFGSRKSFTNTFTNLFEFIRSEGSDFIFVKNFKELLQIRLTLIVTTKSKNFQESLEIHLNICGLSGYNLKNFSCLFLQSESFNSC